MSQQTTIILIAVVVVLLLLVLLLRSRKQRVTFGDQPAELPPMAPAAPKAPIATQKTTPVAVEPEGHGVGDEVSAAIEDVVDQLLGIDAHPSGQDQVKHNGDTLTTLKGLGPKAASRLHELGVTTFAQMAAWDDGDVDAIDAQLGAFKGRIRRDRWVEQASYLAKGDTAGFEAAFGKLG
jgi:predicted flap endonuclease-1-like 5' DNA nuclease